MLVLIFWFCLLDGTDVERGMPDISLLRGRHECGGFGVWIGAYKQNHFGVFTGAGGGRGVYLHVTRMFVNPYNLSVFIWGGNI